MLLILLMLLLRMMMLTQARWCCRTAEMRRPHAQPRQQPPALCPHLRASLVAGFAVRAGWPLRGSPAAQPAWNHHLPAHTPPLSHSRLQRCQGRTALLQMQAHHRGRARALLLPLSQPQRCQRHTAQAPEHCHCHCALAYILLPCPQVCGRQHAAAYLVRSYHCGSPQNCPQRFRPLPCPQVRGCQHAAAQPVRLCHHCSYPQNRPRRFCKGQAARPVCKAPRARGPARRTH